MCLPLMSSDPKTMVPISRLSKGTAPEKEIVKNLILNKVVFVGPPWFWANEYQAGS